MKELSTKLKKSPALYPISKTRKEDKIWIIIIAILIIVGVIFLFSLISYHPEDWSVPGFY